MNCAVLRYRRFRQSPAGCSSQQIGYDVTWRGQNLNHLLNREYLFLFYTTITWSHRKMCSWKSYFLFIVIQVETIWSAATTTWSSKHIYKRFMLRSQSKLSTFHFNYPVLWYSTYVSQRTIITCQSKICGNSYFFKFFLFFLTHIFLISIKIVFIIW